MRDVLTSLRLVVLSVAVCCVGYPALLLGFAQLVVPHAADGSLLSDDRGRLVGSALLAQDFTDPRFFWPRPSAVGYDAAATGGSNLAPNNPALTERARETLPRYAPAAGRSVPAELVAASGSGLDPHLSLEAARFQLPRVAAARGLSADDVAAVLETCTEVPLLRVFGGEPLVNVLRLNIALEVGAR